MRGLIAFLILLFLVSCSSEPETGEVKLICVGLDYANTTFTRLNGTINDCTEFADCLEQTYKNAKVNVETTLMLSKGSRPDIEDPYYPTSSNVISVLKDCKVTEEDMVVFFFSGHGLSRGGDSFIACAKDGNSPYTELWMTDLFEILESKKCPCVVLIDACFSGFLASNGDLDTDFCSAVSGIFKEKSFSNVGVICSSGPYEKSLESVVVTDWGNVERHGLFSLRLLDCLGWVHSPDGGFLESPKQHLTVQKLYESITGSWSSEKQFPVTNCNAIGVNIIP